MKPSVSVALLLLSAQLVCLKLTAAQLGFASARNYTAGRHVGWVLTTEVNGDTKADLIAVDTSAGALTVLTNNGSGGFGSNGTYSVGFITSAAVADVNGDGKVDLIAADKIDTSGRPGRLVIFTNDGTGRFALSSSPPVGNRPESVTAADVNKDGWMDLITANASANTLSVLTNDGRGDFSLSGTYDAGIDPFWVISADVNADGWPDLVCANYLDNSLSVLTNDSNGGFGLRCSPAVGTAPLCVAAADVNGDGKLDLVTANSQAYQPGGNTLSVCTNDGTGVFALAATYPVGHSPCAVVASDVNADSYVDLACINFQDNTLTVLTNNGVGDFTPAITAAVGVYPRGLVAADVNGDGQVDLITANLDSGTVSVLINTPSLDIKSYGSSTIVSYPSCWTNWTLLQATNPAVGNWLVESDIADDGINRTHKVRSLTNSLFFRLSHP